jgi:hypothetical protein
MSDVELSQDARDLLAGWFMFGAKSTVTSHDPHAIATKHKVAIDELIAHGLIKKQPYNKFGSYQLIGTDEAGRIGMERCYELMKGMPREGLAPTSARPPAKE